MQFCNLFDIISFVNITNCNFFEAVNVIFKDLDVTELIGKVLSNQAVKNTFKFINNNKILVKLACVCLIGAMTVSISATAAGITVGYDVECEGKIIATVRDAAVLENAKKIAAECVGEGEVKEAIVAPKLAMTLTAADKLDNADSVANAIIENSADIVEGSALMVNGQKVACVEAKGLDQKLEARKNSYNMSGAENEASFVDEIEVEYGYYLKNDIQSLDTVDSIIAGLQVKTVSTVISDVTVAFSTRKVNTDTQVLGYYKVTTKGQNGLNRKTEKVESINGVVSARTVLANEVITQPVTQVVTVGTAPARVSATEKANASSAGFICPINRGKFVVTAYYGDGRNHKGIDLGANKGTAIFAVAAGKVTYAGYDGDFGYNVVIDHGNGMKTRYAHASALCVSKGQTVSQGDMIATVGSTGYSTGNHLHFEVIVNGTRVNPAPYIGL